MRDKIIEIIGGIRVMTDTKDIEGIIGESDYGLYAYDGVEPDKTRRLKEVAKAVSEYYKGKLKKEVNERLGKISMYIVGTMNYKYLNKVDRERIDRIQQEKIK